MPNYIYKCNDCSSRKVMLMSVSQYKNNKNNIQCIECESRAVVRVYGFADGVVEVDPDENLKRIKAEAKSEAKRIMNGDSAFIHDVYGS